MDPLTNDHSLDRLSSDPSTAQRIVRALCSLNLNSLRILFRNGPCAALSFVSHSYHLYSGFGLPHLWRDCLGGMTSEFRRRKSTNCSRKWIALARPSCFFLFPELSACRRPFPAKTKAASSTGINPRKPGSSSYSSAWMPGTPGLIAPLPKSSSAMPATACRACRGSLSSLFGDQTGWRHPAPRLQYCRGSHAILGMASPSASHLPD